MTPPRPALCDLPAAPPDTCCGTPAVAAAVPLDITNAPGLSSIAYRIGTFGSFRRTMLDRVAAPDLLHTNENPVAANPFAAWSEGSSGDYQTMFVELWAYLADVLTFYQERIANEAYLPTATQLSSLMRLAQLINYRPQPGSAASARVAFTVEKGKTVSVPASFRVSTRAAAGKPAVVYETSEAIEASGSLSRIPIALTVPYGQFAKLAAYDLVFSAVSVAEASRGSHEVFGDQGWMFLDLFPQARSSSPAPLAAQEAQAVRTVVFAGTKNRIAVGDWLLAVETGATPEVCRVLDVATDDETKTTTVVWGESAGRAATGYKSPVEVFAFRVVATPFGSNAPMAVAIPPALPPPKPKPWDDKNDSDTKPATQLYYVPPFDEVPDHLSLDSVYDAIDATSSSPGWVLLQADDAAPKPFRIIGAKTTGRAQYEMSGKVTRLQFESAIPPKTCPLRSTTVYAANELLTVQAKLPILDAIRGPVLILDGAYSTLRAGQVVVFEGTLLDTGARAAEQVTIAETPSIDVANAITKVRVNPPLANRYAVAEAVVYANVAAVTQGETVRNEILGSGNGGAYQTFQVKKSPLTYLPSVGAEGLSAVESTLAVTVNNVLWRENTTLLESTPGAREYVTAADSERVTSVVFGDGVNGATPPTGKDNIRASYRKGIGTSGNVATGAIQVLLDNVAGLQKVANPVLASGGSDAETPGQIRVTAPKSVRTFSRAVSVDDYAALALTYPGVAKASASRVTIDAVTGAALARPYIRLTVAASGGIPLSEQRSFAAALRAYLDRRRDPNVALRIVDFTKVSVDLSATLDFLDDYPREATLAGATAAALDFFSFDRLGFGQSQRLSAIYAMLQSVAGVRSATITRFRTTSDSSGAIATDVVVRSTELAVLKELDLQPGTGGFADR